MIRLLGCRFFFPNEKNIYVLCAYLVLLTISTLLFPFFTIVLLHSRSENNSCTTTYLILCKYYNNIRKWENSPNSDLGVCIEAISCQTSSTGSYRQKACEALPSGYSPPAIYILFWPLTTRPCLLKIYL